MVWWEVSFDGLQLSEEDSWNPEVFNENVRSAWFWAGQKVAAATKKSGGKTAQGFAATGQIIVTQMSWWSSGETGKDRQKT